MEIVKSHIVETRVTPPCVDRQRHVSVRIVHQVAFKLGQQYKHSGFCRLVLYL